MIYELKMFKQKLYIQLLFKLKNIEELLKLQLGNSKKSRKILTFFLSDK